MDFARREDGILQRRFVGVAAARRFLPDQGPPRFLERVQTHGILGGKKEAESDGFRIEVERSFRDQAGILGRSRNLN